MINRLEDDFAPDFDGGSALPDMLGANDDGDSDYSDEDSLFVLEQLQWEPTPTQGRLVAIAVGRDTIVVGTNKCVVILLKVDREPQVFVVGKKDDQIHNLFVDADANHLLVSMKNGCNFYINLTSTHSQSRRRQTKTALSRVKGITIESMVWSKNAYRDSTGLCLLGGANGGIYSLQISDGKEKEFKKLYDLRYCKYGGSGASSSTTTNDGAHIKYSESTSFRVCGLHIETLNNAKEFDDSKMDEMGGGGGGNDDDTTGDNDGGNLQMLSSLGFVEDSSSSSKPRHKKSKSSKSGVDANRRFYIVAVIPSQMYEFIGGPTFEAVFSYYDGKTDMFKEIPGSLKHSKLCVYKPHNAMAEAIAWLTEPGIVLCKPVFGSHVTPNSGVIGDHIHDSMIRYGGENAAATHMHEMYGGLLSDAVDGSGSVGGGGDSSEIDDWHGMGDQVPISFAVTKFHLILVYQACYLVLNRLNKKCVGFERIPCKSMEHVIEIGIADNQFIYVLTDSQIYQIRANDEERDVWTLFLSNNEFANAKKFARSNWQKAKILRSEADYYFDTDRFNEAALKYVELSDIAQQFHEKHQNVVAAAAAGASSDVSRGHGGGRSVQAMREADLWLDVSFEEIALRFLRRSATDALMTFLREKLQRMHSEDQTQCTILATWLTEMHLAKINKCSSLGHTEEENEAKNDFEEFLKTQRKVLSNCKQVISDLIASHGRTEQLVEFARIQQDYKWVLNHYIQTHQYVMAIRVLSTLQKPAQHEELYYEFAPILMYVDPQNTVDMLIKVQCLDPKKLIPALMRYDTQQFNLSSMSLLPGMPSAAAGGAAQQGMNFLGDVDVDGEEEKKQAATTTTTTTTMTAQVQSPDATQEHRNQAIRYLQHCIEKGHEKSKDPAIHNYLISLYCKQKSETQLLSFIHQQRQKPLFDVKYALRLCHQEGKQESCVELYKIMKLYEEAIRLALKSLPNNQYECAKQIAKCAKHEQKRLWLLIAKHVVDHLQSDEIKQVLNVINESNVLSIEDILPYLKDFTEIGPFKKDIKASLEKYSRDIVKLQKEMDTFTSNAEQIRSDTKQLLLRSTMITSNRKCDLSAKPILNTQFILFPCTHVFRFDALCEYIEDYKRQTKENVVFQHKQELIEYASSQCPLCGDMMIDQVTRPFIDLDDESDRKEAESWRVGQDIMSVNNSNQSGGGVNNVIQTNSQTMKPKTIQLEDINIADLGI